MTPPRIQLGNTSAKPPTLWRELYEGTAGVAVRLVVTFALAPLLTGFGLFASYVIAGVVPYWGRRRSSGFEPIEELVATVLVLMGLIYIAAVAWIWMRNRMKLHAFWKAGLQTVLTVVACIIAGVFIEESPLRGADEILIGSVFCVGLGVVILIWLHAGRNYTRGRPLYHPEDGVIDVRCPKCDYRMIGLSESRCPECGTEYTIDQLLEGQTFLMGLATPPRQPTEASRVENAVKSLPFQPAGGAAALPPASIAGERGAVG